MASKFLPFTTSESDPYQVFKALIKRSKGISRKEVTCVYIAILTLGIEDVQGKADILLRQNPTTGVFKLLYDNYVQFSVPDSTTEFLAYFMLNYGVDRIKGYGTLPVYDIATMFVALAHTSPEFTKSVGFDLCIEDFCMSEKYKEDFILKNLKYVKIDKEGKRVGFTTDSELRAFVAFNEIAKNPVTILPVFINSTGLEVPKDTYSLHRCESPYRAKE